MVSISHWINLIVGDDRRFTLENRLYTSISLLNGIANLGGAVFLGMGHPYLMLLQVTTGIAFLLFYYQARFRRGSYQRLYWPFVLLILLFLFVNSILNAGSSGGAHYYLIPALVIATILSRNLTNTFVVFLAFSGTSGLLMAIEAFRPEWIMMYASREERLLDVTGNLIFAQIFTGLLVLVLSRNLNQERGKSDRLLLNVLPKTIAQELQETEKVQPCSYDSTSVLFTDFVGFTKLAEQLDPHDLIADLDLCFGKFDEIVSRHNLEKIKTIGDAYMAVGGVPRLSRTHAIDAIFCGFEIQEFIQEMRRTRASEDRPYWELRLGIHSGSLIAGVVGRQKFIYDVWGDTVNTASRLESCGVPDRINISEATYSLVRDYFDCEFRGKIEAKNKGEIAMYFANRLKPEYSADARGRIPNQEFKDLYKALSRFPWSS